MLNDQHKKTDRVCMAVKYKLAKQQAGDKLSVWAKTKATSIQEYNYK